MVAAASRPVRDERIRYTTAIKNAGLFRDEPEMVRAFMDARVPLALAMRSFQPYQSAKMKSVESMMGGAGYSSNTLAPNVASSVQSTDEARRKAEELKNSAKGGDGPLGWLGDVGSAVGKAFSWAGDKIMTGLNAIGQTLSMPATVGYAQDTSFDRSVDTAVQNVSRIPVLGKILLPFVQIPATAAGYVANYGEGLGRLVTGDLSETQQQDIRRGGGDPNSFASRFSYYFTDLGEKRTPVSDADVAWLKGLNQYNPADVDAAREIVTSGSLDDLTRSMPSLSPQAQAFIQRTSTDTNAQSLLKAMQDTSQTSFGGRLVRNAAPDATPGEWFGPGSLSRGITALTAEVAASWTLGPEVLAAKGYGAARDARWLVRGARTDAFDKTIQMMKASDEVFKPSGNVAIRYDQAMETAEQISLSLQKKTLAGLNEARRYRESWIRRYPGYDSTLDLLVGQRTGTVGKLRVREGPEQVQDAQRAEQTGMGPRAFVIDQRGNHTPEWRLTHEDGTKLTDEERAVQRAKSVDLLGDFVYHEAYSSGRELLSSRLLLPGQLSINGKLRDVIAPALEAMGRRDRSVMKQLKDTATKNVDLNGNVAVDEFGRYDTLLSRGSAEWYNKKYMYGMEHAMARTWRNFERTFSNKVIVPSDPNSSKIFQQLTSAFMPKRQSEMVAVQYAAASPAERRVMIKQTLTAMANVMNLRNSPRSQRMVDKMTKGLIPADEEGVNGAKVGQLEHYTDPIDNLVKVGDHKIAAAVHPYQLDEGIELPNFRLMRHLQNRNIMLDAVTGTADSAAVNAALQAWKVSKTGTTANLMRQLLEAVTFTGWRDPEAAIKWRTARKTVKSMVIQGRVDKRDLQRVGSQINELSPNDLDVLELARRTDPEGYLTTVRGLLEKNGFEPGAAEVLGRLSQAVDIREFMGGVKFDGPFRPKYLALMSGWDNWRRGRAQRLAEKHGSILDSPFEDELDKMTHVALTQGSMTRLGWAADSGAFSRTDNMINENRQMVIDGTTQGASYRPLAIEHAYKWQTADINPALWASQLSPRLTDKIPGLAARLIAQRSMVKKGLEAKGGGELADVDAIAAAQLRDLALQHGIDPKRMSNPDDLISHLFLDHEWGNGMRNQAVAMHYLPDGSFGASNDADMAVSAQHAAMRSTNDLVRTMGGRIERDTNGRITRIDFADESEPLLRKIAHGDGIGVEDVKALPEHTRPEGLVAPIYAPMIPTGPGVSRKLANLAGRWYDFTVATPLRNVGLLPAFVAQKRVAYGHLAPMLEGLVARGHSPGQAAYLLETMANRRAMSRVFKATDNPQEKMVLAEMGEKWFMFLRSQLDFMRRFGEATVANPAGIARAAVLMEAGQHSGIIAAEPYQDENGNTEQKLTFTYPGSALAQKVVSDAGVALGFYPDEMLRVPQFNGFKSQVDWINPSIANPTSFSLNPVFGLAVEAAEGLWPGATVDLERIKRGFVYGGQDFEGTEGMLSLRNMVPSALSRFVPLMTRDDADGQFQSAVRSAMMYSELTGKAPDAGASPAERARYLDAVKATATNILIDRAILGVFAPAAPQIEDPKVYEEDVLARAQGLPNLRSEFFDIRNEYAKRYPEDYSRANSEAIAEFAKRYPGELIVNPRSFSVGSTTLTDASGQANLEKFYVPYTIEATRWLQENKAFVEANPTVALAMMPKSTGDGDFSNEAYKLQLKSDLRTHKDLEKFYNDLTLSDDLSEFYNTRSQFFAAANSDPMLSASINAKRDKWEDLWKRTHPLAAEEMDRRANPYFVHGQVAPSLDRILDGTDPLPDNMKKDLPAVQEMYNDYQAYRERFMAVSYYDNAGRSKANKAYQKEGDLKWIGTPVAGLWDLMRVTEGR